MPENYQSADYRDEALALALEIADDAAPELITSDLISVTEDGDTWYDLDSATEDFKAEITSCLRYCDLRGLLMHHPKRHNLIQTLEP